MCEGERSEYKREVRALISWCSLHDDHSDGDAEGKAHHGGDSRMACLQRVWSNGGAEERGRGQPYTPFLMSLHCGVQGGQNPQSPCACTLLLLVFCCYFSTLAPQKHTQYLLSFLQQAQQGGIVCLLLLFYGAALSDLVL